MGCKFVNVPIKVHHTTVHAFLIDLQFILDSISQSVNNHNIGRNYQKRPLGAIDHVKTGLTRCSFCRGKAGCTTNHYGRTLPSSPSCLTPWMLLQLQECARASSLVVDGYWWALICRHCNIGRRRATTHPLIPHMTFTKPQRTRFCSADPFFSQWKHILVQLTVLYLCSLTIVWRMRFYDGVLLMKLSFLKRYYYTSVELLMIFFFKIHKSG